MAKKRSKSALKKLLWKHFTKYVKNRDGHRCFTCGKYAKGQGMGGGHYKPAGACGNEYYFHEKNVHAQCTYCNLTLQGDQVNYRNRLIAKYGIEAVEDIDRNYHKPCPDYPFEAKIEEYKEKIAQQDT